MAEYPLVSHLASYPKKNIIFDLDRTLIELTIDWSGVFTMLFDAVHSLYPHDKISIPHTSHEFYTLYSTYAVRGGQKVKRYLVNTIEKYETEHYGGYTPNQQLLNFIRSHSSQYTFALWTSNTRGVIADFLTKESMTTLFKTIVTLNDVNRAKPHPDGFLKIYDRNSNKSDYLMVGDRSIDQKAAQNAGIDYFQEEYFNAL